MKKFVALMLALLYITASGVVVLNVHYCMGNFSFVDIESFKSDDCEKCGMADISSSCCFSELKVLKVDYLHKALTTVYSPEPTPANAPQQVSLIDTYRLLSGKNGKPVAYAPLLNISPDLNILHCVFRV